MRFNRDRRGYETTALVHTGGRRRRGQRLLYFFRTPPGVRVGRAPIDEEAIRLLEQHNPDVEFDWTRILKDPQPSAENGPERRGESRGDRRGDRRGGERGRGAARGAGSAFVERRAHSRTTEPSAPSGVEDRSAASRPEEISAPDETSAPEEISALSVPEEISAFSASEDVPAPSAARARLGPEALGRLRARYAEVLARIAEQPLEEEAREQLKLRAERLNPDGWVTTDEVAVALEQYETVFEELRALVGRHPRGRRGR